MIRDFDFGMDFRRARSKSKAPHKVLRLTTYERLDEYLRAFAKGHFHLMILVGAGGLAKSRSVRAVLSDGEACWIEGNATPFGMYAKLYRHRDQFVVIDDVDALYADRPACGCSSVSARPRKRRPWPGIRTRGASNASASREFTTKSRVVIISNDWQTLNKNVAALQDRGHVILFQPSASEVHAQAGKWFEDEEIYGWFAANLHRVREPSLRHYVRAKELKAAGMDWTEVLAAEEENPPRLAAELLASPATPAPRRASRRSWSRREGAGRRFSTISGGCGAAPGEARLLVPQPT